MNQKHGSHSLKKKVAKRPIVSLFVSGMGVGCSRGNRTEEMQTETNRKKKRISGWCSVQTQICLVDISDSKHVAHADLQASSYVVRGRKGSGYLMVKRRFVASCNLSNLSDSRLFVPSHALLPLPSQEGDRWLISVPRIAPNKPGFRLK